MFEFKNLKLNDYYIGNYILSNEELKLLNTNTYYIEKLYYKKEKSVEIYSSFLYDISNGKFDDDIYL